MSGGARPPLERLVAEELRSEAPEVCRELTDELRSRYGDALDAVLFYGSCLREQTGEGVLDFYALVDDYRAAHASRPLAWLNAALPPNVFHLSAEGRHAKVAVVSTRDFAKGAALSALRPVVWARFSQPFAAAWVRDEAARAEVVSSAATALRTAVVRGLGLLPLEAGEAGVARTTVRDFWIRLYRETYASELRPESDARVTDLCERHPERYARVLDAALETLALEGRLAFETSGDQVVVRDAPGILSRPRRGRRYAAKAVGIVQLLKSAFTFGDWMPYALWKLERHTGTRLEPTDRQLRHPFLFAWPLIIRVLAKRELR